MGYERAVALVLLAFSLGYGYMAADILLLPFQAQDKVTPRTMPYLLSAAGALIALLMLLQPPGAAENKAAQEARRGLNWRAAGLILAAVLAYGALLRPAGFVISTLAFLFFCSYVLGERRWRALAAVYLPIVFVFWLVMTRLLGQTL